MWPPGHTAGPGLGEKPNMWHLQIVGDEGRFHTPLPWVGSGLDRQQEAAVPFSAVWSHPGDKTSSMAIGLPAVHLVVCPHGHQPAQAHGVLNELRLYFKHPLK